MFLTCFKPFLIAFPQDLKLLPLRDPSHYVERINTSVYCDREAKQVMLVYAPTGGDRLEFMLFETAGMPVPII